MKDKDFAKFKAFYEPLMPTIRNIGIAGQIISGTTMLIAVCMIINAKLSAYHWSVSIASIIIIGGCAVYLIEGGQRKLLPYVVRQLMQWNFANRFWFGMFIILFIISIALMVSSALLSWNASPELVDLASAEPEKHDINLLSNNFNDERNAIIADFKDQERIINRSAKDEIRAINAKYDDQIRQKRKQAKTLTADTGKNWIINSVIPNLNNERNNAIAKVNKWKSERMATIATSKQTAINSLQQTKSTAINTAASENQYNTDKQRRSNKKWGMFLAGLTLLGLLVFVFSVVIHEMYLEGSRDKRTKAPEPSMIPVASTDSRPRNTLKTDSKNRIAINSKKDASAIKVQVQGFKKRNGDTYLSKRDIQSRLGKCRSRIKTAKKAETKQRLELKIKLLKNAIIEIDHIAESQK